MRADSDVVVSTGTVMTAVGWLGGTLTLQTWCVMYGWNATARTGRQLDEATVAAMSAFTIDTGLSKEVLVYVTRHSGEWAGILVGLLLIVVCLLFVLWAQYTAVQIQRYVQRWHEDNVDIREESALVDVEGSRRRQRSEHHRS